MREDFSFPLPDTNNGADIVSDLSVPLRFMMDR